MIVIYVISILTCLMHWYTVQTQPSAKFVRELYEEMEYRDMPMLFVSFIPLVNTFAAAFLFVHMYVTFRKG
jgi:hypothetical protein